MKRNLRMSIAAKDQLGWNTAANTPADRAPSFAEWYTGCRAVSSYR